MEIKQETRSLPRNRKCGNCRYFEPAPLWRKGWCRNPRLYDRRANHLVDAATIDCEQVFRARIYWEPVPTSETADTNTGFSPFVGANSSADSGIVENNRGKQPNDGVLRPRGPVNNQAPTQPGNLPMITRRERAAAAPGIVPKPSKTRRWLIENIPYYDRIDGPLSRINFLKVLPWVVVIALILFLLLNVVGGKKDSANNANNISPTTSAVTSVSTTSALFGDATPGATVSTGSKNAPTPTLSNIVPTATPAPTPTATAKPAATQARVVGAPDGVNMRKDPGLTGQVLKKIAPGKVVTIRSAEFKTIDGGIWWPVNYEGQDGWILSSFLEKINP